MMSTVERRLLFLALIAAEVLVAVVVLRWLLGPDKAVYPARPTDARRPIELHEAEPTAIGSAADSYAPPPASVWVAPELPAALISAVREWVTQQPDLMTWAEASSADLEVDWHSRVGAQPLADMILVPVAPFPSLRDDITTDELRRNWLDRSFPQDPPRLLLVSPTTAAALDALFGVHYTGGPVTVVPADELTDRLWSQPDALAIVPFDRLEPRLKTLALDGLSALDPELDLSRYPLLAQIEASGPGELERALAAEIEMLGLDTNRHPDRLTTLVMTGVTALTRGVAYQMEVRGDYAWPAWRVADLLASADLTHISNEVSFKPDCLPEIGASVFCSKPEYIETLRLVGTDLVELTGNHNLDFGSSWALLSLDLYAENGMRTFGGGRNATEAGQPLLITHNGNRLAFVGYNQFGPDYAWATAERPGAARFWLESAQSDLAQLRTQADLIFVNIQHTEAYRTVPLPQQVTDFRAMVDAGADVVTGSQAHQPQAIEFQGGKPIFYGLGNLFFDQTWSEPTQQSLIIRHVIHDGQLIASQVIPTIAGDGHQPYPAVGQERDAILQAVFAASAW